MTQQRQVEKPFTGIVEQVQAELGGFAPQQASPCRAVADRQAQLADAAGGLRPMGRLGV
ncbi:hypothetical protein Q427_12325 [Halomonas sp. BC04]|nr:hypothetical protein Q427_12325 [Halomonas sp. BC04]